ncbi:4a-hydroxytetrahydrobiopterin dehydratase [Allosphingosinicella vermicomposti]|uniref:4a-hydroxytetrahydrobiopterin dehydratase n=1 Tax=Allosphingosinicella vermicomposti TaxID=614671 RepID=UPI000D0FB29A|nr:4a-hydroxytetrahydrobiopterin dehydratase [Allosphingosinicella vermicomposti]
MPLLTDDERAHALCDLDGWTEQSSGKAIRRVFRCADFAQAFAFMTRIAPEAEKANHHPDWSNSWNRVDIRLTTHSVGGVTEKDVALAKVIDALARQLALPPSGD